MYGNLKRCNPNEMKGDIGEIIAWHNLGRISHTKNERKECIIESNLNKRQKDFLMENWNSFDLVDLEKSIIYEVKTKNYSYGKLKGVKNKPPVSKKFIKLLEEAKALNFEFNLVSVTFYSNWRYGIEIKGLERSSICSCEKKSGWKAWKDKKELRE